MIAIVIPAFDEATKLAELLPALPDHVGQEAVRVVVVDDGSSDATRDVARSHGAHVIVLSPNQGKGAALRAGLDAVAPWPATCVALMDADGQHDPLDLACVVGPVLDGDCDVSLGSRFLVDGGRGRTPRNRWLVRRVTVAILRSRLGVAITDPFCGYRCLSAAVAMSWRPCGDRYEAELELLLDAVRNGWSLREVPVSRIYTAQHSKMGAMGGPLVGRLRVLRQYATTIARKFDEMPGGPPGRTPSRPTTKE